MTTTTDFAYHITPFISDPQEQFINLLKDITNLQWVRESLPVQSKYYDGLKQRQEREAHLKSLLEKQILELRRKQDASSSMMMLRRNSTSSNNDSRSEPSYTDLIERLRRCEAKLVDIETQIQSAETMLQDLHTNKNNLDTHCSDLHTLYDEIVPNTPGDPAHIIERHLKEEVSQLANDIPQIEKDIESHSASQKKLYQARELMEKAMMTLPGATTFLDRQALAGHGTTGQHSLFMKSHTLSTMMDITVPSLKDAEKLASEAYGLELEASKLCKDVPLIPNSTFNRDDNVIAVLTAYRGYRLKIESILRTQLNPRLNKLQSQLAITKYHYEQKTIEWIDQQIIILEDLLRQNGCLQNVNLDREISMLRMGSNAAMVAVAAETSGRVTVDDALEVVTQSNADVERNGVLPEYSANARGDTTLHNHHHHHHHNHHHQRSTSMDSNYNYNYNNYTTTTTTAAAVVAAAVVPSDWQQQQPSPSSPTTTSSLIISPPPPPPPPPANGESSIPTPRLSLENSPSSHHMSLSPNHLPAYSQRSSEEQQQNGHQHDHQRSEYSGPEAPPAYFR